MTPATAARNKLINIDNGGTLTDICVIDGPQVWRTKTLTTPHDLSQCLFEGLRKASRAVYGEEDLQGLLLSTQSIRYSTTQGTNALVERKGPRLGLLLGGGLAADAVREATGGPALFDGVVGDRVVNMAAGSGADDTTLEAQALAAINTLAARGANRLVVSCVGPQRQALEARLKRLLLRSFPPHLLGALPILYAGELVDDADDVRRTWTALFNAFLHPAMERFLYAAEHKLRDQRIQNPLLVFRNDGYAGRVAKTIAVKTYSSGPRGGMEGAKAFAAHHGLQRLLSMDIGGTTTDIGLVDRGVVRTTERGRIEGVATSFPLCDVVSAGVGGSSIIRVEAERVKVGPQSVGSAPGPACFGLGGTSATMTDGFLLAGLLDPASFFGGDLKIDVERARNAVRRHVGQPLGLDDDDAVEAMEAAWVARIADSLRDYTDIAPDTTLAAFGGAGPFVACRVAEAIGVRQVVIPGLAAVFSAFGIGFSDIGHQFSAEPPTHDAAGLQAARADALARARRGMFGEGVALEDCQLQETLALGDGDRTRYLPLAAEGGLPADLPAGARWTLQVTAIKPVAHAAMAGHFGTAGAAAQASGTRRVLARGTWAELPLYRAEEQAPGARATGPAVLEEAFFTCRIDAGWAFEINAGGDILLTRA